MASESDEVEVDSNESLDRAPSPPALAEGDGKVLWMPAGDMTRAHRIAHAFINEDGQATNPARSAIF